MEKQQDPFQLGEDGMKGTILASKKFFERDSVLTVSGKYSEQYFVSVQPVGEFDVEITISAKAHSSLSEDLLKQFMNDLIDQQIRIDLQKEFGQLRNIIIEYAFSPVSK